MYVSGAVNIDFSFVFIMTFKHRYHQINGGHPTHSRRSTDWLTDSPESAVSLKTGGCPEGGIINLSSCSLSLSDPSNQLTALFSSQSEDKEVAFGHHDLLENATRTLLGHVIKLIPCFSNTVHKKSYILQQQKLTRQQNIHFKSSIEQDFISPPEPKHLNLILGGRSQIGVGVGIRLWKYYWCILMHQ